MKKEFTSDQLHLAAFITWIVTTWILFAAINYSPSWMTVPLLVTSLYFYLLGMGYLIQGQEKYKKEKAEKAEKEQEKKKTV